MPKSQSDVFNLSISSPIFWHAAYIWTRLVFDWRFSSFHLNCLLYEYNDRRDSSVVLRLHLDLTYQMLVGGGEWLWRWWCISGGMICREYLSAVRKTCLCATVDCLGMVPASPWWEAHNILHMAHIRQTYSVALVRKQTILTKWPLLVGEVSANFWG
jgi:hypothetical protein